MNLSKIHHIAIIVSDYEAAKNFYVNKLGFSVIRENYRSERNLLTKGCFQRVHKNIQNVTQI